MQSPDPGIGNERTAFAWQRTALSLVAGAAIMCRLTFDELGGLALLAPAAAVPLAGWVLLISRRRYRRDLNGWVLAQARGGRAPTILALATVVLASTEAAVLFAR